MDQTQIIILFQLNEENSNLKRKLLVDQINSNGVSLTKITDDMNELSNDMCRIQTGVNQQLTELQLSSKISSEFFSVVSALDECDSGKDHTRV